MNTNIFGKNGFYSAIVDGGSVKDNTYITWGFSVAERYSDCFTIELANELLEKANNEYKKRCTQGYSKKSYNPNIDFTYIKYDMTNYYDNGITMVKSGDRKVGIYDKKKNLLRIYINGEPVYENYNGTICRDTVAIMDSDPVWNGNRR